MTNTLAPFGFRAVRSRNANAPNFAINKRRISKSYGTAIYHNDAVVTAPTTGYINVATGGASVAPLAGIFVGCEYFSLSQNRFIWMPYWSGNTTDAAADPECYVIDDPDAVFAVQVGNGASPLALSAVQSNINLLAGTGSNYSGLSGMSVDSTTQNATSTLQFRIVGYVGDGVFPGVGNGSDPTSPYNIVFVAFNNMEGNVQTAPNTNT
jgi:hypothetical protein